MGTRIAIVVGGNAVLIVWIAAAVVGTVTSDYTLMQLVTPIMLTYAGYLFGEPLLTRIRNGKNGGSH